MQQKLRIVPWVAKEKEKEKACWVGLTCSLCTCEVSCCLTDYGTSALAGKRLVAHAWFLQLLTLIRVYSISACVQWFLPTIGYQPYCTAWLQLVQYYQCMSESPELIPEMDLAEPTPVAQPPVTGGHAGAGNVPGLVFPAPASVQQFNVFAPQYSVALHINQVRLEVRELEAHAERRHRQHIITYEEAAIGLANMEERAEKNHLEAVAELQAALATSEYKAVNREKTLIAEMSILQAQALDEDRALHEELAEMSSKHISDALDQHLAESRFAENLREQANHHVEQSQHVMVEQFQAHFTAYEARPRQEFEERFSELREQNDELQDRLDSAERALEKALEQAHPATPKGQPVPAPGTPSQNPFAVPKAPTAPLFATPNVIPQSARNLFESMNPGGVTASPIFPGTPTAGPSVAKAPSVTAPPAAGLGAPTSDVLSTGLLETQMAILSRLRDMNGETKEESSKPKVKEAETINLPDFPNPESYRSWKTATREAVRAASDSPDEAFKWVLEAYDKDANHTSLRDPGKFLTLDTKLLAALTKVARGELSREILIFKETEATKSRAARGRQVLYLFDQYFKTNEEISVFG